MTKAATQFIVSLVYASVVLAALSIVSPKNLIGVIVLTAVLCLTGAIFLTIINKMGWSTYILPLSYLILIFSLLVFELFFFELYDANVAQADEKFKLTKAVVFLLTPITLISLIAAKVIQSKRSYDVEK